MTGPLQRRAIADGVWFSRIHDPKFYHNSISVTIITPLAEGKTSAAVLAAYLLRMGSRRCRDMTELECRLADLYGAVLDTDVSRHGENQLLTFSIAGADDRFALEGELKASIPTPRQRWHQYHLATIECVWNYTWPPRGLNEVETA